MVDRAVLPQAVFLPLADMHGDSAQDGGAESSPPSSSSQPMREPSQLDAKNRRRVSVKFYFTCIIVSEPVPDALPVSATFMLPIMRLSKHLFVVKRWP